jgi:hypothetical protein
MKCPHCGNGRAPHGIRITNVREADDASTRRRRECNACGKRFTTVEVIVADGPGGQTVLDRLRLTPDSGVMVISGSASTFLGTVGAFTGRGTPAGCIRVRTFRPMLEERP